MDHAHGHALPIDDGKDGYGPRLVFFHDGEGLCRQLLGANGQGLCVHDVLHCLVKEGIVLGEGPADNAVRQDADELPGLVHDGDGTEALLCHDEEGILRRLLSVHHWIFLAGVHGVLHPQEQATAEGSAGVEQGEVLGLEVSYGHGGDGDGVPHGKGRRGACGGGEPQGAGLLLVAHIDDEIGELAKLGVVIARHGDDLGPDAADDGQDIHHLGGLAAIGDGQDDIAVRHHAQIPVEGLRWMHEEGGRPGAGQRRCDLSPDMAALSHARDDDTSLAGKDMLDGLYEVLIDIFHQLCHGGGLCLQGLYG